MPRRSSAPSSFFLRLRETKQQLTKVERLRERIHDTTLMVALRESIPCACPNVIPHGHRTSLLRAEFKCRYSIPHVHGRVPKSFSFISFSFVFLAHLSRREASPGEQTNQ